MSLSGPVIEAQEADRMQWWKAAKFGLFVHWGLYALHGKGEWHMSGAKIPVKEYEKLAERFNPVKFDAREWVALAKAAGMKYIVVTAKHHDGFAMYHSEHDPFNIVDATPFRRDPLKELAEECQREGLRMCFYYSHVIDWHHPHAIHEFYNNTWDYPLEEKAFYAYWNRKAKPQVKELLTKYGPVGLIWFDTAGGLSKKDSQEMIDWVRDHQPTCLINSRVSHWPQYAGDYSSKGDNEIPMHGEDSRPWETPMTLNDSWGYQNKDQSWKSSEALIRKLVHVASKGGNLLLNVGPTAEGDIPDESVERLKAVGRWTSRFGEAIYDTTPSPFHYEQEWGAITVRDTTLYLLIHGPYWSKGGIDLYGLNNAIRHAYVLQGDEDADEARKPLSVQQHYHAAVGLHQLHITLPPSAPDDVVSVVALELDGKPHVDPRWLQLPTGDIRLDIAHAEVKSGGEAGNEAGWSFTMLEPGEFDVVMIAFKRFNQEWSAHCHQEVIATVAGQQVSCIPAVDKLLEDTPTCQHPYEEVHSVLGRVQIRQPGEYDIRLQSAWVKEKTGFFEAWQAAPIRLRSLQLVKVAP
ncbi:alpha-L-fucosidase [Paenibacillus sp. J5C_2022]|uniref:alpha-L-fucosidase n=1 Tax=Paenibacillus sp. J5C2022 TaxID=2977129 RepID=UPI0021D37445|nr:alpha-L-fucosidase [Paenibacillus sp. J5C2022]MCU6712985.1 alpha-L-fucosidase [Paenibacillus sp. J5C2022]